MNESTPLGELYRRLRLTAGARFNAARRLTRHDTLAQWSLALSSVALVGLGLVHALGIETALSPRALNVIQVILAVLVLVTSLLISRDNFALRADRMHRCGIALNTLKRRMEPRLAMTHDESFFQSVSEEYDRILNEHENHEPVDYDLYRFEKAAEFYPEFKGWQLRWARARARFAYGLVFWPYLFVFGALLIGAYLLIPTEPFK